MIQIESTLELRINNYGQKGLFALRDYNVGDIIAEGVSDPAPNSTPGWPVMNFSEAELLPKEQRHYYVTYGMSIDLNGGMAGPLYSRDVQCIENYINHSCNPNIWYGKQNRDLVEARLAIKAGMHCKNICN